MNRAKGVVLFALCFVFGRKKSCGKERCLILITNNPKFQSVPEPRCDMEYIAGSYRDVLILVRDRIHQGHKLLSHPLSGSVKPNETPYKSILISKKTGSLDVDSLQIIEDSISTCDKFMQNPINYGHNNQDALLADFSEVDYGLIVAAIASASR